MSGIRSPFAGVVAESTPRTATEATQEETIVFNSPPEDETTLTFYLLIKRRPRQVFVGSSLFIGADLADAKRHVVEQVFGTGFPDTDDELLERYNVDVIELDDEWERKLNELAEACSSLEQMR